MAGAFRGGCFLDQAGEAVLPRDGEGEGIVTVRGVQLRCVVKLLLGVGEIIFVQGFGAAQVSVFRLAHHLGWHGGGWVRSRGRDRLWQIRARGGARGRICGIFGSMSRAVAALRLQQRCTQQQWTEQQRDQGRPAGLAGVPSRLKRVRPALHAGGWTDEEG